VFRVYRYLFRKLHTYGKEISEVVTKVRMLALSSCIFGGTHAVDYPTPERCITEAHGWVHLPRYLGRQQTDFSWEASLLDGNPDDKTPLSTFR